MKQRPAISKAALLALFLAHVVHQGGATDKQVLYDDFNTYNASLWNYADESFIGEAVLVSEAVHPKHVGTAVIVRHRLL